MDDEIRALLDRYAEIGNLHRALAVLEWDLHCYMPPGGARARAEQIGVLSRMAHEKLVDDCTHRLLNSAEEAIDGADPDSDEARSVKNFRRDFDRAAKIPAALAEEFSRHSAAADRVWRRARATSDFA